MNLEVLKEPCDKLFSPDTYYDEDYNNSLSVALFLIPLAARPEEQVVPRSSPSAMVMDAVELPLQAAHLLLAEQAPHQTHVLSFDYLCRSGSGISSPPEQPPQPPDLHTPITTTADAPSFFGPGLLDCVEPPPITGLYLNRLKSYNFLELDFSEKKFF